MAVAGLAAPAWGHPSALSQAAEATAEARRLNQQTMWLVLYVLLIIVAPMQHGLAVIAAGPEPWRVRSKRHLALNLGGMLGTVAMLVASVVWQQWIFLTVTPIGFLVGLRNFSYGSRGTAASRDWEREHLTSMLTAGITLHTAFFVFGTSRSLGLELHGLTQLLPWTVPALVGGPIIFWLRAKWRGLH